MEERNKPATVSDVVDAVAATNTKVLGEGPGMEMGSLHQTVGESLKKAAANAVYAQQQANVTNQTATTLGVTKLFSKNK